MNPAILSDAVPEWITVPEAAYVARVPEGSLLRLVDAGTIRHVALLPDGDRLGMLVSTSDVRAALVGGSVPGDPLGERWSAQAVVRGSGAGVSRRSVLATLGAAVAGGLLPVRALAGGGSFARTAEEEDAILALAPPVKVTGTRTDAETKEPAPTAPTGKRLVIRSVRVEPDPVPAGGEAVITIDASPKRRGLMYALRVSEGAVVQDPGNPSVWTWRDA